MNFQRFKYTKYETQQEEKRYKDAYDYASLFCGNKNADICKLYSRYCQLLEERNEGKSDASAESNLKVDVEKVFSDSFTRNYRGIEKYALYLLGVLLFSLGSEDKGIKVLEHVAETRAYYDEIEQMKDKDFVRSARCYLEKHYRQQWENSGNISHLENAANCFAHGLVCHQYADKLDKLVEQGGDIRPEIATQYRYEHAIAHCVDRMNMEQYILYRQLRTEDALAKLDSNMRHDFGAIVADLEELKAGQAKIERKIDELSESTLQILHEGFSSLRGEMSELQKSMRERDLLMESLLRETASLVTKTSDERETLLQEIASLVSKIEEISCKSDDYFQTVAAKLENVLHNSGKETQVILDDVAAQVDKRFGDKLKDYSDVRQSIVSAWFMLKVCERRLSQKSREELIDYSGVVILATGALEKALSKKIFEPYMKFLKDKFGLIKYQKRFRIPDGQYSRIKKDFPDFDYRLKKDKTTGYHLLSDRFTLGDFIFLVGVRGAKKAKTNFREYIKKVSDTLSFDEHSIFYKYDEGEYPPENLRDFANRVDGLINHRNAAGHTGTLSYTDAEEVCINTFLAEDWTRSKIKDIESLLGILLNSYK